MPQAAAAALDAAAVARRPLPGFPGERPANLATAYAIQDGILALRAARGDRLAGVKVGLTREEKWAACGANDVIVGGLTASMIHGDGVRILPGDLIAPKVEGELAFRLARPLSGPISLEEALDAIDGVAAALEIIDSRVVETGMFDLFAVVGDNSNSAGAVIGPWHAPMPGLDDLAAEILINDTIVAIGNTRTVSGNPLRSVCAAARLATRNGQRLEAGSVILAGSLAPARPLLPRQRVTCRIAGLAPVSASFG